MQPMFDPIILSTWKFGMKAVEAGWPLLTGSNPSSLDAVEQACRAVEDDIDVVSVGRGGCPDRSGEVSLDASIMVSPSECGSVCYVRRFAHPISIARRVMEKLHLVLVAGDGADRFATRQGMTPENLLTDRAKAMWNKWAGDNPAALGLDDTVQFPQDNLERRYDVFREAGDCPNFRVNENGTVPEEGQPHNQFHDTVGVLAIDARGKMAGACSSSGLPFKIPGRVGDSPIIGHGLYVDPRRGAAVATGMGELIMGVCGSFLAVELMGRGASPQDAACEMLQRILDSYELCPEHQAAIITLNPLGQWSSASLRPGYRTAVHTSSRNELVEPDRVLLA
jgi:N4-(beta-N-acetylglucosaminyl)-L-asparaginase